MTVESPATAHHPPPLELLQKASANRTGLHSGPSRRRRLQGLRQIARWDGQILPEWHQNRKPAELRTAQAATGMRAGRSKTVATPASLAYGPHVETKVFDVDRGFFPDDVNPTIGQRVEIIGKDGKTHIGPEGADRGRLRRRAHRTEPAFPKHGTRLSLPLAPPLAV